MPTMHDSNEGQTQHMLQSREAAHARHIMRMLPPERQDEAIIRHYAACAAIAMQGLRFADARRAGQSNDELDNAIKHAADLLRKAHLSDFGIVLIDQQNEATK